VTRLAALALWAVVAGNALFALLAIALRVCALNLASAEVHQVQLRLSPAGLAVQLFETRAAEQAARDNFDLLHRRDVDDEEHGAMSIVEIGNTPLGGAEFVALSTAGIWWISSRSNACSLLCLLDACSTGELFESVDMRFMRKRLFYSYSLSSSSTTAYRV
jgi:hypothetical protein